MLNPKTPGVFIQEVSTLPASVAPVATAIPAFVGYTERNSLNDEFFEDTPVRITSLLEYVEYFGGPFDELYGVTLTGDSVDFEDTTIAITTPATLSPYLLYYSIQVYFANGGGPCYVVSVGTYQPTNPGPSDISVDDLTDGLDQLEQEDEPTLLVIPEAVQLQTAGQRRDLYDAMLQQCNKLQDRFSIMDVVELGGNTFDDGVGFRNNDVSADYLNYGAAYYPSLKTSLSKFYTDSSVAITDSRTGATFTGGKTLETINLGEGPDGSGTAASGTITITNNANIAGDSFTIGTDTLVEGTDFNVAAGPATTAGALETAINNLGSSDYTVSRSGAVITITASNPGVGGNSIALTYSDNGLGVAATVSGAGTLEGGADSVSVDADKTLYAAITRELLANQVVLYPSSFIAGVYARVDRDRGVWKAPANVGVNLVASPSVLVTNEEQGSLNVDATSGKSINVIRTFTGKGTLVWGARTLAGNDNEWRYVPVRRLFIFIEESIQKATEPTVFEPNDANTWTKLRTMIENFLTSLWREGALAGASPEDAFFVKVGLGETMTALDILEGRLNVEIGLAAVRPAEFIILKFSHKLQES